MGLDKNRPPIEATPTAIKDVLVLEPQVFEDERGSFMEIFQRDKYSVVGITSPFVQDNLSFSRQGVLRGLHYQVRQSQGKLVQVLQGGVFDVAVDIRRSSPTFGHWVGVTLNEESKRQLWVPPGFAHGFYVLSERAVVLYKVTDFYASEWERTIIWNDPDLNIEWPLLEGQLPILSSNDARGKPLLEAELYP